MTTLERHDDVFALDLGDTENRFHPDWLTAVGAALDEVEGADGPAPWSPPPRASSSPTAWTWTGWVPTPTSTRTT